MEKSHHQIRLRILSCCRMSENHREPEVPEAECPCKDYLRGTCNNSFCEKWHPPEFLFYKTKSGCRFGEKLTFAHHQVDEQPTNSRPLHVRGSNNWRELWQFWEKEIPPKFAGFRQLKSRNVKHSFNVRRGGWRVCRRNPFCSNLSCLPAVLLCLSSIEREYGFHTRCFAIIGNFPGRCRGDVSSASRLWRRPNAKQQCRL